MRRLDSRAFGARRSGSFSFTIRTLHALYIVKHFYFVCLVDFCTTIIGEIMMIINALIASLSTFFFKSLFTISSDKDDVEVDYTFAMDSPLVAAAAGYGCVICLCSKNI